MKRSEFCVIVVVCSQVKWFVGGAGYTKDTGLRKIAAPYSFYETRRLNLSKFRIPSSEIFINSSSISVWLLLCRCCISVQSTCR